MRCRFLLAIAVASSLCSVTKLHAQPYGSADRGQPGDAMIQNYLRLETDKLHERYLASIESADDWQQARPRFEQEYLYMLGLWPLPEKTPLEATVTGTLEGDGYKVDLIHYQSMPGLYVTGNLYRPAHVEPGERLPAVFYVCGHSPRGRDGNKTAYQSHGIWFARHGYVCLVVDTLQLGEIAAIHHGTYRYDRWWWHARGYTSAGVECWNGVRGIDYLTSRDDVDPERIAVTGISGGGAATFWIAAADERVKVAVPVSGMADLPSYVTNRVINGHCDCMFLYNTFRWPWTRIAGLIAPRPMLFVNSDADRIFPMDANGRVINRLERLYSLFGAGDLVDSVVSVGGHAYRQDIRQSAYRFINTHLKGDPRRVTDGEVDLVTGSGNSLRHPIEPERLRVFPSDADLPDDERNTTIDEHFVPMAKVSVPENGRFESWKRDLLAELRRVSFGYFPDRVPAARALGASPSGARRLGSEVGIEFRLRASADGQPESPSRILMVVVNPDEAGTEPDWLDSVKQAGDLVVFCETRGVGETRWTQKNPPNYVRRSHVLLGRTVDAGRVWDVAATARLLNKERAEKLPIHVAGQGAAGAIAAYAALWEPEIEGVTVVDPSRSHMDSEAPQFLNVLRVCDVPDALGMLAPRPLTIMGGDADVVKKASAIYAATGASEKLSVE